MNTSFAKTSFDLNQKDELYIQIPAKTHNYEIALYSKDKYHHQCHVENLTRIVRLETPFWNDGSTDDIQSNIETSTVDFSSNDITKYLIVRLNNKSKHSQNIHIQCRPTEAIKKEKRTNTCPSSLLSSYKDKVSHVNDRLQQPPPGILLNTFQELGYPKLVDALVIEDKKTIHIIQKNGNVHTVNPWDIDGIPKELKDEHLSVFILNSRWIIKKYHTGEFHVIASGRLNGGNPVVIRILPYVWGAITAPAIYITAKNTSNSDTNTTGNYLSEVQTESLDYQNLTRAKHYLSVLEQEIIRFMDSYVSVKNMELGALKLVKLKKMCSDITDNYDALSTNHVTARRKMEDFNSCLALSRFISEPESFQSINELNNQVESALTSAKHHLGKIKSSDIKTELDTRLSYIVKNFTESKEKIDAYYHFAIELINVQISQETQLDEITDVDRQSDEAMQELETIDNILIASTSAIKSVQDLFQKLVTLAAARRNGWVAYIAVEELINESNALFISEEIRVKRRELSDTLSNHQTLYFQLFQDYKKALNRFDSLMREANALLFSKQYIPEYKERKMISSALNKAIMKVYAWNSKNKNLLDTGAPLQDIVNYKKSLKVRELDSEKLRELSCRTLASIDFKKELAKRGEDLSKYTFYIETDEDAKDVEFVSQDKFLPTDYVHPVTDNVKGMPPFVVVDSGGPSHTETPAEQQGGGANSHVNIPPPNLPNSSDDNGSGLSESEKDLLYKPLLANKHEGSADNNSGGGRLGKQQRLRDIAKNDKTSTNIRGWIKQEENSIARGQRKNIRNPRGKELAHERGREAAKGYGYEHSNLQDKDLHRLQHRYDNFGKKNKERPPE